MTSEAPIIIIGAGRSGSTLFHDLASDHPRAAWLSALTDTTPDRPQRNRWVLDNLRKPLLGRTLRDRYGPDESYRFWDHYFPGFSTPCRDLHAGDLTPRVAKDLRGAFSKIKTDQRDRLLLKVTGWPRTGFLRELWPDAKFIHVVRDGRAVANSLLSVDWWRGWQGPSNWRWGPLSKEQNALWNKHDQSFIALAGIQWNILMDATVKALANLPKQRVMEVRYESLCADPVATFGEVLPFCSLEADDQFMQCLRRAEIRPANDKWRNGLTKQQQLILDDVTSRMRDHFGYP